MNDAIDHETIRDHASSAHPQSDWRIGKVLLNEYVIIDVLGTGGMGKVYLVEPYRFSGMPLAVKTLKTASPADHEQKRLFMNELRTWCDLPEHPFISSFRFFRTIEDRIAIFSEFVNGGSLDRWIHDGRLLAVDSILDVAIQLAWGLYAAHESGVIHQDVKPANVLMTRDGIVKITDFGLANACNVSGIIQEPPSDSSRYLVSCRGMTFAYSSPEQTAQERLTIRSDIWSYGLTVFQMFTGKVTWKFGLMAPQLLAEHTRKQRVLPYPPIPEGLVEVLEKCFRENPKERWTNMREIAERLIPMYRDLCGRDYPRPSPVASRKPAGTGAECRQVTPQRRWLDPGPRLKEIVSKLGMEHLTNTFSNAPTRTLKTCAIHDLQLYEEILRLMGCQEDVAPTSECALLMLEKANIHRFLGDRPGELDLLDTVLRVLTAKNENEPDPVYASHIAKVSFKKAESLVDLRRYADADPLFDRAIMSLTESAAYRPGSTPDLDLARVYSSKANTLQQLGNSREALEFLNRAIALREDDIRADTNPDIILEQSQSYMHKSAVLNSLGRNPDALDCADQAIRMLNRCIELADADRLQMKLAQFCSGKANLMHLHGRSVEAIEMMDQALGILERIKDNPDVPDPDLERARITMNKAIALWEQGSFREAIDNYNVTIEIRERLIHYQGRRELEQDLSKAFMNKANALVALGEMEESLVFFDRSIAIRSRLVNEDGHLELEPGLATVYMNKAACLSLLGRNHEALEMFRLSIGIFERLVYQSGKIEMEGTLARVYMNTGIALNALDRNDEAISMYDRSITITERLMRTGRREFAIPLAKCRLNKSIALREENKLSDALKECETSNDLRRNLIEHEGHRELLGDLAWGLLDRVDILVMLGNDLPEQDIRSAVELLRKECLRTGRADQVNRLRTAERKFRDILDQRPQEA